MIFTGDVTPRESGKLDNLAAPAADSFVKPSAPRIFATNRIEESSNELMLAVSELGDGRGFICRLAGLET